MPNWLVNEQPEDWDKEDVQFDKLNENLKAVNIVEGDGQKIAAEANADYEHNERVGSVDMVKD